MNKYKNIYRISSARLANWDYGTNATYFITSCTKDRICFFRNVQNGEMIYNQSGQIAQNIWDLIPIRFPYIRLENFVVMPNHVHGTLIIDGNVEGVDVHNDGDGRGVGGGGTNDGGGMGGDKNPMIHNNISRVIRWYIGRSTTEIRKIDPPFGWQS